MLSPKLAASNELLLKYDTWPYMKAVELFA